MDIWWDLVIYFYAFCHLFRWKCLPLIKADVLVGSGTHKHAQMWMGLFLLFFWTLSIFLHAEVHERKETNLQLSGQVSLVYQCLFTTNSVLLVYYAQLCQRDMMLIKSKFFNRVETELQKHLLKEPKVTMWKTGTQSSAKLKISCYI